MNSLELRQKIEQNLLTILPENLKLIDEFVEFIKYKSESQSYILFVKTHISCCL